MWMVFTRRTVVPVCQLVLICACVSAGEGNGGAPALPVKQSEDKMKNDFAWLSVKDTHIVTSPQCRGGVRPFLPIGIGYCRDVCLGAQDEQVMQYCKARHLNTVRLSFYTRFFNNDVNRRIDLAAHLRNHVDPVVQAAKRHGLYVVLDDHAYFSGKIDEAQARQKQNAKRWDEQDVQDWIARWVKVAEAYRDEPYVMAYELQNEPHDLPAETVCDWYGRCIKAIRQMDTRHIIIVGSAEWSHARSLESTWAPVAKTLDAPYNQVVFAFHDYPKDNDPPVVQKHVTAFRDKHGVPVLCTEFGALPKPGKEASRQFETGILDLCDKQDIGWMVWTIWGLKDSYSKPPSPHESCAYTDLWVPAAEKLSSRSPMPEAK
jgi:aryl-phospho-beta-D-glucosidase BglC (GH1 family)